MSARTERRVATRRTRDYVTLDRLQGQVDEMHKRLFNGLGLELRKEVKDEIGGVRNLFIGVLIAVMLSLVGVVVEGRISAKQATTENNRTYKAIIDIGSRLENHIIQTVTP